MKVFINNDENNNYIFKESGKKLKLPNKLNTMFQTFKILFESTVLINTIQNNTIQNNTIQNNTIKNNTIQNNTIQNNTIQNNTIKNNKIKNNTIQIQIKYKTIQ